MAALVLALKLTLAPSLVAAATRVARALGHKAGGVVGGLPVVAAPILLIYALEHGADFAARAAHATLLGIVSLVAFCVAHALVVRRAHWAVAILAGWLAFGACTAVFDVLTLPLGAAAAAAGAAVLAASWWFARLERAPAAAPRSDLIPWRLAITAAMVVTLTAVSGSLSPWLSGLLAPFPIITAVLAGFSHAQAGPDASIELLAGLVPGLASFVLFFLVLAVGVSPVGVVAAFLLATGASLASHAGLVTLLRRDAIAAA